jgi:glycosyltransferase involved in cell wall biosynthesis
MESTRPPRSCPSPAGRAHVDSASEGAQSTLPVAVVVPAFNRADMLKRALASVWAQEPALPAEIIVVDDGSADRTAAVAEECGATVIRHPHNQGLSAARNSGVRAASQPWVALLDSDDEWLPHHLRHLWGIRGDHVLVAASSVRCGTEPATYRFHGPVTGECLVLRSGDRLVYPGNIIPVSAAMVRREAVIAVGGFRPRRGVVEDMDLWLRLMQTGTAICSPCVGAIYHVHSAQMSRQDLRNMQLAHLEAAEAHRQRTGGSRAPIEYWEAVAAWDNLRDAVAASDRRTGARWGVYIARRPRRLLGLAGIWIWRYLVRRRSAAARAAAVGPAVDRTTPRSLDTPTRAGT